MKLSATAFAAVFLHSISKHQHRNKTWQPMASDKKLAAWQSHVQCTKCARASSVLIGCIWRHVNTETGVMACGMCPSVCWLSGAFGWLPTWFSCSFPFVFLCSFCTVIVCYIMYSGGWLASGHWLFCYSVVQHSTQTDEKSWLYNSSLLLRLYSHLVLLIQANTTNNNTNITYLCIVLCYDNDFNCYDSRALECPVYSFGFTGKMCSCSYDGVFFTV